MAIGSGIEAGKAYVKFILDDKEFKSKLESTGKSLIKFGSIGAAATAPIVAGLTAATLAFANAGSALHDMSLRTGVSAEALSELKYAAEQSGTSMEGVEKALRFMAKNGLDPNRFQEIAAKIAAIQDPAKRTAAAMKVFGRAGTSVLPMLENGAAGLQALRDKAHALGITLTDEDVAAADALGDAIDTMKAQFYGMAIQVGAAIAGPLTEFLTWSQSVLSWTIGFIKENPRFVSAIAAITASIAALSAAMIVLGTVMLIISAHPIVAALVAILSLIIGIATYFGLASQASGQFKTQLDSVRNIPGVAAATSNAASRPVVSGAMAAAASGGGMAEVAHWTKESASSLAAILEIMRRGGGGLVAGAF